MSLEETYINPRQLVIMHKENHILWLTNQSLPIKLSPKLQNHPRIGVLLVGGLLPPTINLANYGLLQIPTQLLTRSLSKVQR